MKKFWLDLETTGLNPSKHSIIQIAGMVEIDGEVKETFCLQTRPLKGTAVSNKALEVVKVSVAELKQYPDPAIIKQQLLDLFNKYVDPYDKKDKFIFLGYNAKFDYDFFRAWFEKQNFSYFGSFFWFPPIDIMNMVAYKVMGERHNIINFKLFQVCKYFGIDVNEEELHDALYDIELTKKLYETVTKNS
jgi:DNA polymerase-3 subunit epsilon|tara:strand:- start:248 stop:814 length:567 start_codon:yes stop_codon:yes gene_type:complete